MKAMGEETIFDASEEDFEQRVIEASRDKLVLVDFWAEWCAPCVRLAPVLEKVVRSYEGTVLLARVEADDNMRLAGAFRVKGFPSVLLFQNGEEKGRFAGFRLERDIREFIETWQRFEFAEGTD